MAGIASVFLDTSVLIGGLIEIPTAGRHAGELLAAVAENKFRRAITAWHCCLEFYSVTTRLPEEFRLSPADAVTLLRENVFEHLEVVSLRPALRLEFLDLAVRERAAGGRIYDAHLARIARAERVDAVVTDNIRHFSELSSVGIRVLTPAQIVNK